MENIQSFERRYDIDWLRVIAIGMLLVYHIAIVFQPWGRFILFISNEESIDSIWPVMAMMNIWRIPLLFFVSGMGVFFAARKRNWKQLLGERAKRILIPLLFGIFFIVPIHIYLFQSFYSLETSYEPGFGHLWFLYNIIFYFLCFIGLAIYFPDNPNNSFLNSFRWILNKPGGLYVFIVPFIVIAELFNPQFFSIWYEGLHAFFYCMYAFFLGLSFVAVGDVFWQKVSQLRSVSLIIAVALYLIRYQYFDFNSPHFLTAIESITWIFTAFGFGYKYLNRSSKKITYLSSAAYPIYIIHMAFQYLACYWILPLEISAWLKLILIILTTYACCFLIYEFLIRRVKYVRPLFGLKLN
jgi:glucan biosynthesis protein C